MPRRDDDRAPWDPGLQHERTGLAWQRTALSGLACSLLVARLLVSLSVTLAVVTGVLALGTTVGLGAVAVDRFHRNGRALAAGEPLGDARPQALAAVLVGLTALAALVYVLAA